MLVEGELNFKQYMSLLGRKRPANGQCNMMFCVIFVQVTFL